MTDVKKLEQILGTKAKKTSPIKFEKDRKFPVIKINDVEVSDLEFAIGITMFPAGQRNRMAAKGKIDTGVNSPAKYLTTVEIAVLQFEIAPVVKYLSDIGGSIVAVHNHWLFMDPLVMYVHWQVVDDPIATLEALKNLWKVL